MRVLITGATGFIGSALSASLVERGDEPLALHRGQPTEGVRTWDIDDQRIDDDALEGVDAVVHLAGAPIGPWLTDPKRREIMQSRRDGTRLIAEAVATARPQVFISGSAIGYYGDSGDTELTETSPRGAGFLADVAVEWESAAQAAVDAGVRTVKIRTGLVMDASGGLLAKIILPFKLGLGGPIGSGDQWWSWITLRDEVRAIIHCLEHAEISGPVNLTAPNPVRNRDFVDALGDALRRPTVLPLPAFALRAIVGPQFADEAVLASQRVLPTELHDSGFEFVDRVVDDALASVV